MVATRTIFLINSDFSFRRRFQQNWTDLWELECRCSDQKIYNVANSGGSLSSIEGAVWFDFGENCHSKLNIQASGWIPRQKRNVFWFFTDEKNFCQDQMLNSQNNHWLALSPKDVLTVIKSAHIMVFGVVIGDGNDMPLFIFPRDLILNMEAYINCLEEVVLPGSRVWLLKRYTIYIYIYIYIYVYVSKKACGKMNVENF